MSPFQFVLPFPEVNSPISSNPFELAEVEVKNSQSLCTSFIYQVLHYKMAESLVRKRGSLKSSLTNFVKYVDSKRGQDKLSEPDLLQLEERVERIKIVFDEFNEVQNQIEVAAPDDSIEREYEVRSAFEDTYYSLRSIAMSLLATREVNEPDMPDSQHHSSRNSIASEAGISTTGLQGVKLPVITLPKYQGNYDNWLEFRETFESLVHNNESLSPIQKYHYLRASLEGSAALVIKAVEFTSTGYDVAWQVLRERYNNTKLLVHNHIKLIFGLEEISKECSYKLRKLVDDLSKHLRSLEQLKQDIKNWDPLLIFLVAGKLDAKTLAEWEKRSANLSSPTLDELKTFLRNRADLLETLEYKSSSCKPNYEGNKQNRRDFRQGSKSLVSSSSATGFSCFYCKNDHSIYKCGDFLSLPIAKRVDFVKRARLCTVCLLSNHTSKTCRAGPCRKCKAWHNSLLHPESERSSTVVIPNSQPENTSTNITKSLASGVDNPGFCKVLLSTVKIIVFDKFGQPVVVRALLDSGSQSSFITEKLSNHLGLETSSTNLNVLGISSNVSKIKQKCVVSINSQYNNFKASVTCFVLSNITSMTPSWGVDVRSLNIPKNLQLADPEFNTPAPIDMLIGAELFWVIIKANKIICGKNKPVLQDTVLGWIVSGRVSDNRVDHDTSCNLSVNQELCKMLSKFWETEECGVAKYLSREELECERGFERTTQRDSQGRFIVTLPLKQDPSCLGESRAQALKMFYNTERRLSKNEKLRSLYNDFLSEYLSLNHMSLADDQTSDASCEYFMPHHGVLRERSKTTRLRVVMASRSTVFNMSVPSCKKTCCQLFCDFDNTNT